MRVEFDPDKRLRTLQERGLDFMDAPQIFAGNHVTFPDRRRIYGEDRYITSVCLFWRLIFITAEFQMECAKFFLYGIISTIRVRSGALQDPVLF